MDKTSYSDAQVEQMMDSCHYLLKTCEFTSASKILTQLGTEIKSKARKDNPLLFKYYFLQGRCNQYLDETSKSLEWYSRALNLPDLYEIQSGRDRVYCYIGEIYTRINNYPLAIKNFEKAIAIQELSKSSEHINLFYYKACLAKSLFNHCEPVKAYELMQQCDLFVEQYPNPIDSNLLDLYLVMIEYHILSEHPYLRLEKLMTEAGNIMEKYYPKNHYQYAKLHYLKGLYNYNKYDKYNALPYFEQSLKTCLEYPHLSEYEAMNYRTLASFYYNVEKNYPKTIEFCRNKMVRIRELGLSPVNLYYQMGRSYKMLQDTSQALYCFKRAIDGAETFHTALDIQYASASYCLISTLYSYYSKRHFEEILFYLKKAIQLERETSLKSIALVMYNRNIGLLYYRNEKYKKALEYIQEAIIAGSKTFSDTSILSNPSLEDITLDYDMIETFALKANALVRVNTTDRRFQEKALECTELGARLIQKNVVNIRGESDGLKIVNQRKRTMNNAVIYAVSLFSTTGEKKYAEKAFEYAEKSKMQLLFINTSNKKKQYLTGIPDSIIQKEEQLNNAILNLENQILINQKKGLQNQLPRMAQLTDLYDELDEFSLSIAETYPTYFQSRYDLDVAGIDEIQQMLNEDQVLIEYQLLVYELITFVISKNDFVIYRNEIPKDLRNNIEKLSSFLSVNPLNQNKTDFDDFVWSSHFLYTILIEPIYSNIKNKRLIIVPHNELTLIPFEVLLTRVPDKKSEDNYRNLPYLIKEFPVVYAYSANFLLDDNLQHKKGRLIAIFLPDYKSNKEFQVLKGARKEAEFIKKMTNGTLYTSDDASEIMFKKKASKYGILHIASHTLVDEENPNLSCIIMSSPSDTGNDGYLYAYELMQMKLKAKLVVLSGCNTGYGKLRFSEGLISLARSFFYTGVRTVVFSLWPVTDNSGSEIISFFYRGLKKKKSLDVAMRQSKIRFIEQADPVKVHPYYWANYMILGNTENPSFQLIPEKLKISVCALVFLLAVCLIFIRRFKS